MAARERYDVEQHSQSSAAPPSGARLVFRPASHAPRESGEYEHLNSFTNFILDPAPKLSIPSPAMTDGPRVLLVEGEAHSVAHMLEPFAEVTTVDSAEAALVIIDAGFSFDVIMSDLSLDGMSGITFFSYLAAIHPYLASRFIAISCAGPDELDETLKRAIGQRLLVKPVCIDDMLLLLRDVSHPPTAVSISVGPIVDETCDERQAHDGDNTSVSVGSDCASHSLSLRVGAAGR